MKSKCYVAMITPFTEANAIDYESAERIIEKLISEGVSGLMVCGTTGESPTLSENEKLDFLEFVINQVNKPKYFRTHEMVAIEDIYYPKDIKNGKDLYDYIAAEVLKSCENLEAFFQEVDERNAILSPERKNQLAVLRSFKDILHQTFLKIIICDKPFRFKDEMIQTIIVYNSRDNNVEHLQFMSRFIARLMHSDELIFTFERMTDYEIVRRVLEESE